jgi:hypothetical protein
MRFFRLRLGGLFPMGRGRKSKPSTAVADVEDSGDIVNSSGPVEKYSTELAEVVIFPEREALVYRLLS